MEIGGRPPKLYASKKTYSSGKLGGGAAGLYGNLINVQPDRTVEGVDIPEPTCVMSQDFTFNSISWKFVKLLMSIMWHTNNAAWYTFKQNEVALIGVSIKPNDSGQFTVNYRWGLQPETVKETGEISRDTASPPGTSGARLPETGPITIPGWAYLWVRKESYVTGGLLLERPDAYYVEQILPETDFTQLGIGS
jgi:hypothetical protein